jgi:hypothetical protein
MPKREGRPCWLASPADGGQTWRLEETGRNRWVFGPVGRGGLVMRMSKSTRVFDGEDWQVLPLAREAARALGLQEYRE